MLRFFLFELAIISAQYTLSLNKQQALHNFSYCPGAHEGQT